MWPPSHKVARSGLASLKRLGAKKVESQKNAGKKGGGGVNVELAQKKKKKIDKFIRHVGLIKRLRPRFGAL